MEICPGERAAGPLTFWAKLGRGPIQPKPFHPLLCHMVDVARVTLQLWRDVLAPATRRSVVSALGVGEEDAARWVAFWAGLHDIGKASPVFQLQDNDARARITKAGLPCPFATAKVHHGTVTVSSVRAILQGGFGVPAALSSQLGTVLV